MIPSPSAASHAHRPSGRLTAVCLILVLAAASLAPAAGLHPYLRPATAAHAAAPLAPEVLTWRQRTPEEWASADFSRTTLAAGGGVGLAEAAFVLGDAGDFNDTYRYTAATAAFDADGDGDLDLALGNEGPLGTVELLLNDGSGHFAAVGAGALGAYLSYHTTSLAAFDADGDGDLDLALGSAEETPNALFLNDGAGRFARAAAGDFGDDASFADSVLAFDADGDGDIDLACGRYAASALYRNDGAGRFVRAAGGEFAGSDSAVLAALDADGDGDTDLATPGRLYRNDGAGNFTLSPAGDFGSASGPALVPFDADGDGDTDLATPGQLYRNNGAGGFTLVNAGDFTASGGNGRLLLALDADRDGDLDLAMTRGGQPNAVYLNNGAGVFTQVEAGQFDDGAGYPRTLAALDADGDGAADLALSKASRTFLYRNQGGGRFDQADAGDLSNEARTTRALSAFDANRDGAADLAIAGAPNALFLNDGSGRFSRLTGGDYGNAGHVVALAPFDADGDGDIDLATANSVEYTGEANRLLRNDGNGRLALVEAGDFDDPALDTRAVVAFDADGDGDLDLAVGNWNAANALYLSDGQGSFSQVEAGSFDDPNRQTAALLAFDADGDGDADLAVLNQLAARELHRNDGAGIFTLADAGEFDDVTGGGGALAVCDVDGDGDLDLVALDAYPGVYLNDGQGWFSLKANSGQAITRYEAVAALDYDGDGDVDLAIGRESGPPYLLLANDGTGRFDEAFGGDLATSRDGWAALAVLDADGDNDLDLARSGQVLTYENLFDAGSVTSPVVDPAQLYPTSGHLLAWQQLSVREVLLPGTAVRYDVLDAATGAVVPGFANLRPDAAGQIDLAGISAAAYPAVRLRATLLDLHSGSDYLDYTPRLYEWAVTFSMAAEVPPPRVFDAFRAATPPTVDGDLSDWPDLPVLLLDYTTAETIRRIVPMPDDNSAELRGLWTPNALYFAVHVRDDVVVKDDSPNVWWDDQIELAIDGRHDLVSGGPDDHQYTVNADGRISDGGNALLPPPIGAGVREVSGGWDVEVRLPIADLQTGPLYGGRQLGFTLGLHDDDDYGDWDSYMIWEGDNTVSGAAGFGVLRLVDAYQPASWQQRTYRDWFHNQHDRTTLAGDSLAVAGMGQFPSSTASINVVMLDVDGDGDIDLAVGGNGVNALYKNDGAGSYTRVEAGAFDDTAANTITLVVLDMDGDGAPDLAESNDGAANAVYRNDGAGIFSRLAGGDFAAAGALGILTAIDADGDGRDDLAAPRRLYLNNGAGSFTLTPAGDYSADAWRHTNAIVAADLDGDGDVDLAVGNAGRDVNPCWAGPDPGCDWEEDMLYLNAGTGQFTRSTGGSFSGDPTNPDYTVALAAFDADNDGDVDLLDATHGWCWDLGYHPPSCSGGPNWVHLNDGNGVFSRAALLGEGWTTHVAAGDLDGDGDMDVAAANDPLGGGLPNEDSTPNSIYLNDGSGHYQVASSAAFQAVPAGQLRSLDADGDGAADLLLNSTLYRSQLAAPACVALAYGGFVRSETGSFAEFQPLAAFDADGDGDVDVAGVRRVGDANRNQLYLNDGAGNFHLIEAGHLDDDLGATMALASFDADGDGDIDLAAGHGGYGVSQADTLYFNDGPGVFTRLDAGAFDDPVTNTWAVAPFDADGDGDIDLAVSGPASRALYLNNGEGFFTLASSGDFGSSTQSMYDLVAFDADGDGDIDLLPASDRCYPPGTPTTLLYRNDGHGAYTATDPGELGEACFVSLLATLDADGDGDTDVVHGAAGIYGGIEDGLWLNDGDGHFSAGQRWTLTTTATRTC